MKEVTTTTKAAGVAYEVTFREFESVAEAREAWEENGENPDEVVLGIINSAQKQGATQGGKGEVREAVREDGDVEEAIASHQETALGYVVGAPRSTRGGLNKTAARKIGEKAREADPERLREFAAELGLTEELGL